MSLSYVNRFSLFPLDIMFTSVFMLPGILFSLISLSLTVVYKIIITFPVRPFWSIFGFSFVFISFSSLYLFLI